MTNKIIAAVIFLSFAFQATAVAAAPFKNAPAQPVPRPLPPAAPGAAPKPVAAPSVPQASAATAEAELKKGTAEVSAAPRGAVNYIMPETARSTFETSIEKLTIKAEELPETISLASVAKMKTNPHIATTQSDFVKICKEAFRNKISPAMWRAAQTTFFAAKGGEDDTLYILVAIEYKRDTAFSSYQKEASALKRYLKKETSDEYVLMENFPFLVVLAANQNGDYEFSVVKELAERLKIKIYGTASIQGSMVNYEGAPAGGGTSEAGLMQNVMRQNPAMSRYIQQFQKNLPAAGPQQPSLPPVAAPSAQPSGTQENALKAKPAETPKAETKSAAAAEPKTETPVPEAPKQEDAKTAPEKTSPAEKKIEEDKKIDNGTAAEKNSAGKPAAAKKGGIYESKNLQKLREKMGGGNAGEKKTPVIEEDITPDEN